MIFSDKHSIKRLTQNISIAGFGSKSFKDGVDKMIDINDRLAKYLPPGILDLWEPTDMNDIQVVHASTRYVTDARDAEKEQIEVLSNDIDPEGFIRDASEGKYVYTVDNAVSFFRRVVTGSEEK